MKKNQIYLLTFFLFSFAFPKWKKICDYKFNLKSQIIIKTEKHDVVFFVLDENQKLYMFESGALKSVIQTGYETILGAELDGDKFWSVYVLPKEYDGFCPLLNLKVLSNLKLIDRVASWSISSDQLLRFKCKKSFHVTTEQIQVKKILEKLGCSDNLNSVQKIFYKISKKDEFEYKSIFALIGDLDIGFFIFKWV